MSGTGAWVVFDQDGMPVQGGICRGQKMVAVARAWEAENPNVMLKYWWSRKQKEGWTVQRAAIFPLKTVGYF